MTIYNSKIGIISNTGSLTSTDHGTGFGSLVGGTAGTGETNQAYAQAFKVGNSCTITKATGYFDSVGTPTDYLVCDIVTTQAGSSLATASVAASVIIASPGVITFTFSTPFSATSGTQYYLRFTRSGPRDVVNAYSPSGVGNTYIYSGGVLSRRDNNTWADVGGTFYLTFTIISNDAVTLLEPQYLLSNTVFVAGTGLQTNLTKWDSTEWLGVTNTYTHQLESNVSANVVELDTAAGTQLVGSPITTSGTTSKIYTASPVTMPANGNLDTKATTNNGGVFANRILVAVSVVTTNIATINRVAYSSVSRWVNVAKASIARINGVS